MYNEQLYHTLSKISELKNNENILKNILEFYVIRHEELSINLLSAQLSETFKIDSNIIINYITINGEINKEGFNDFEKILNILDEFKFKYSIFFKESIIKSKDPFRITKFDCAVDEVGVSNLTISRNDNVYLQGTAKIEDLLALGTNLFLVIELLSKNSKLNINQKHILEQGLKQLENIVGNIVENIKGNE
ncbi:hypothetical protein [uncultured Clostridium sp.]|jgi:hypothetical protein|uniref:hypothetical protein n=1 Tax=uncultured Clostridium sp. TaxID=59620 RepID=UPI00260B4303|nr:hypothetical protein [uncultured Clostridium sp.]